jgi:7-cyano-7-deazaguanine synthase
MKKLDEGKALVIFSGGQDSTACLGWAIKKWGVESLLALTFDYGQRHRVEIKVAKKIARGLGVENEVFKFDLFSRLGDSALVRSAGGISGKSDGLPVTFVPGRNIMFLSIASAIAYKKGIANMVVGVSSVDYSGYPDCRPEFISSMRASLVRGLDANVKVHAPILRKTKAETFLLAQRCGVLEEALESHTCYDGIRDKKHPWGYGCGKCPACKLRKKGYGEFLKIKK